MRWMGEMMVLRKFGDSGLMVRGDLRVLVRNGDERGSVNDERAESDKKRTLRSSPLSLLLLFLWRIDGDDIRWLMGDWWQGKVAQSSGRGWATVT
ncbi:hypothetical protein GOBAR_AA18402 [Gossypium barbadense]|uniref:Uncharacterized protein n=1 Tax=Gossypium barbadense TaxID=3634 RepID=A0A2P5XFZ5_GOSBA|nr:hypothetical protein GOBAR_AA18402 [Gossypium barbadense]